MVQHAMKGVNLGGWLVAEKWMTPSIFSGTKATNEHQLSRTSEGRQRLKRHHERFITEDDLAWLKEHGVQILRVPFGHWVFGDYPPYVGSIERLDWVVRTAAVYGMKVLLDLHGAPDAQNAYAHSGSGNRPRDRRWLDNRPAQRATIEVLVRIAERYRNDVNVWGIQLLNEPDPGLSGLKLARFYRRAYRAVVKVARPGTRIVFSDGYAPLLLVNALGVISKRDYPAVMDCHFYQCFGRDDRKRDFAGHLRKTRRTGRLVRFLQVFQPVIVGEWSAMLPYAVGPEKNRQYWWAQEQAYGMTAATFYWNYRTEAGGRWNFRTMIETLDPDVKR